jgi:4-amino-4-deoxychorismate lyase
MFWYCGELLEGDKLCLEIDDPGLLYGATVFTTLRVYQQSLDHPLTHWAAHCDRLHRSLEAFVWQVPDWQRLRQGAEVLAESYPVLRMTIFADGREWIAGRFLPDRLTALQHQGVKGWVAESPLYQRPLAAYKTGNYLGGWLALRQAEKLGAREAILVDDRGNWLETSTGNLWGWRAGKWWTPVLEGGILPGIARSHLLEVLGDRGIGVQETLWTADFIEGLEAIAYSNSVVEVIPFTSLLQAAGERHFNAVHPALTYLRECFGSI